MKQNSSTFEKAVNELQAGIENSLSTWKKLGLELDFEKIEPLSDVDFDFLTNRPIDSMTDEDVADYLGYALSTLTKTNELIKNLVDQRGGITIKLINASNQIK